MAQVSKQKAKSVGTKVTQTEYEEIVELVDVGAFLSVSDFARKAIQDKLGSIEVIEIRDVDYDTAKEEILEYYKKHQEAYIDEVADDLRLDLELVNKITDELVKEGHLGLQ